MSNYTFIQILSLDVSEYLGEIEAKFPINAYLLDIQLFLYAAAVLRYHP